MLPTRVVGVSVVVLTCLTLTARAAEAQQSASSIAGVVKDASGQPVAAVTVEAASPVLIEMELAQAQSDIEAGRLPGALHLPYTNFFDEEGAFVTQSV